MTWGLHSSAGRALRSSPRTRAWAFSALALVVSLSGAACAGADGSGSAPHSGTGADTGSDTSSSLGSNDPSRALLPDRIGDLELEVIEYRVPDALDVVGGPQLETMLAALDLSAADVSLVMAVDRASVLAIGRWGLPGRNAAAILAAWSEAAGSAWQSETLGGEPALAGSGPDGRRAWAVARDAIFVYVVTDDPNLAEQAISATH